MRRVRILRFEGESWEGREDWVAEEGLIELEIASGSPLYLSCTPEGVRELVYGHLLAEGLIRGVGDVLAYREELDLERGSPGEVVRVAVTLRGAPEPPDPQGIIWTPCGRAATLPSAGLSPLEPRPLLSPQALLELPRLAARHSEDFRLTGAYHYAFLFDPSLNLRAVAKDIGRHNAVDKAIGAELLSGGDLGERILFVTGRISADIALKALRAGVPLIASRGAALLGAITLAHRYNLGLVGFLRGGRFNLYCGEGWLTRKEER